MCVIISSPSAKHRPTRETLCAAERTNPHGSGIAWIQDKRVQWVKGLTADSIADLLPILSGPVVIHFRIATAGGKRPELCHPFPISPTVPLKAYGQAGSVLFHNGHWHGWEEFLADEGISFDSAVSDSRVIAAGVHRYGSKLLKDIPCRFAILSRNGIERFGDWSAAQEDGCRYSNLHWQAKAKVISVPAAKCPAPVKHTQPNLLDVRQLRSPGLVREAMACYGD